MSSVRPASPTSEPDAHLIPRMWYYFYYDPGMWYVLTIALAGDSRKCQLQTYGSFVWESHVRYNNVYMSCEQCRRKSLARADRGLLCLLTYSTLSYHYVSVSVSIRRRIGAFVVRQGYKSRFEFSCLPYSKILYNHKNLKYLDRQACANSVDQTRHRRTRRLIIVYTVYLSTRNILDILTN